MLSIQYCQCNTINTILLVNVILLVNTILLVNAILLVNTILIINCKQLESFKVRAKFSSHPLHILFPIRSKSALNPFSNPLQILFPMQKY